jgi:two-component system copper resistance phosphate regulon response regulator CusR
VCRRWRAQGGRTPILMLTARNVLADRVRGLDAGADDYLPKPFAVEELLARLRALARRPAETLPATLSFEDLELDTAARIAHRQGREIRLTAREYALLEYLMRNPNRVLDRGRILEHVWDDNFDPVANAVDVLVGRVRRKLDPDGERPLIFTLRGMGYMLSARRPPGAA